MAAQSDVSKFLHVLSHDIKNILQNIQGYVNILEGENNKECLEGITRLVHKGGQVLDEFVAVADKGDLSKKIQH